MKNTAVTIINSEANKIKYGCIFCLARSAGTENVGKMKKEMYGMLYSKLFNGAKGFLISFASYNARGIKCTDRKKHRLR